MKLAIGGKKLAISKNIAPMKIVKRLTTFVCATMPTFCEKVVNGKAPNKAPTVELRPSKAKAPPNSRGVGFLFKPETAKAVVSPMASIIAQIKHTDVRIHGTGANCSFVMLRKCGKIM